MGPQFEIDTRVNGPRFRDTGEELRRGLVHFPVGGAVEVSYGAKNTLGLFLGYDFEHEANRDGIAGRFTYIRCW